jgi:hypothetical protein
MDIELLTADKDDHVFAAAVDKVHHSDVWETWTRTATGEQARLVPLGGVNDVYGADEAGWYPEWPGEREPWVYVLIGVTRQGVITGEALRLHVKVYDGFSPYDGAAEQLWNGGWTVPLPEYEECIHRMAAAACYGPYHYAD